MNPFDPVSPVVIGAAFRVHNALGPGYLEHVYRNGLALELGDAKLEVRIEVPLTVSYKGAAIGHCAADLVVEGILAVETKAQESILPGHMAQLRAYLRCSGIPFGLVVNFGPARVDIKRVALGRAQGRDAG